MKLKAFTLALGLFFLFAPSISAHSGRTDSSGGHNCSAKSISKGLCSGYHYHNGGSVYIPSGPSTYESIQPTKAPTPKPTPTPTPTAAPTTTPIASPMVEGASTVNDGTAALFGLGTGGLFLFGGYKGLKWLGRVTAPKEPENTT